MLLLAHFNVSKNEIKKKGVEEEMMWGFCIGLPLGALLMKRAVDEVEEEKEKQKKANEDLRYENEEQQGFICKIIRIMLYEKSIFDRDKKIKELIHDYQSEN